MYGDDGQQSSFDKLEDLLQSLVDQSGAAAGL
jgi:hypothetical protein